MSTLSWAGQFQLQKNQMVVAFILGLLLGMLISRLIDIALSQ